MRNAKSDAMKYRDYCSIVLIHLYDLVHKHEYQTSACSTNYSACVEALHYMNNTLPKSQLFGENSKPEILYCSESLTKKQKQKNVSLLTTSKNWIVLCWNGGQTSTAGSWIWWGVTRITFCSKKFMQPTSLWNLNHLKWKSDMIIFIYHCSLWAYFSLISHWAKYAQGIHIRPRSENSRE